MDTLKFGYFGYTCAASEFVLSSVKDIAMINFSISKMKI